MSLGIHSEVDCDSDDQFASSIFQPPTPKKDVKSPNLFYKLLERQGHVMTPKSKGVGKGDVNHLFPALVGNVI
jgi:hypothetical protein